MSEELPEVQISRSLARHSPCECSCASTVIVWLVVYKERIYQAP